MKLNLKALGLALVAMFAMSAIAASSASAKFTFEEAPATLTGEELEQGIFEVTGVKVTCNIAEYEGEATETSEESVKVVPTFTECKGSGLSTKVTGFGHYEGEEAGTCWFVLHTEGTADLECKDEGDEITVEAATCVVHIPQQTGLTGIEYTTGTREGKHDLTLHIDIHSIKATHTDGFLCPMTGSGEGTEGTLKGEVTAWAESEGEPLHLTHDLVE